MLFLFKSQSSISVSDLANKNIGLKVSVQIANNFLVYVCPMQYLEGSYLHKNFFLMSLKSGFNKAC